MKQSELQQIIQEEVQRQLKAIVPKLVKPLVQEAVAGALANLLAEGIVKGAPLREQRAVATSPREARPSQPAAAARVPDSNKLREEFRAKIRRDLGYADGLNPLADILTDTAVEMADPAGLTYLNESTVMSVDDHGNPRPVAVDEISPTVLDNLTKNYSGMMQRLKK